MEEENLGLPCSLIYDGIRSCGVNVQDYNIITSATVCRKVYFSYTTDIDHPRCGERENDVKFNELSMKCNRHPLLEERTMIAEEYTHMKNLSQKFLWKIPKSQNLHPQTKNPPLFCTEVR